MREHANCVKHNAWIIEAHERKDARLREEYVSQRTAWFVEQKEYLLSQGQREEAKEVDRQTEKQKNKTK